MSADPDEALIRIDVRFRDLDAFGHVYHAEYLTILDEARTRWFGGGLRLGRPGEYVVARVEIDYLSPAVLSDAPLGASFELHRVGTSSLTTVEETRGPGGPELRC